MWRCLSIRARWIGPTAPCAVWIDGRPVTDRRDVKFLDSRHGFVEGFFHWEWTPVWGGMGGVRDREDRMQIDHVFLAGRRD